MEKSLIKVGFLEVNCALVPGADDQTLYVIDPGGDADLIVGEAKRFKPSRVVILLTHAHVDHISALSEVNERLNADLVFLHRDDVGLYNSPNNNLSPFLPAASNLPTPVDEFSGHDVTIIHTPGHTRGGVCFHFPHLPALFSGDTLFRGSIGRTDLPGGDHEQLLESIKRLLADAPDDLPVHPGHGPATTIGWERENNPFL